MILWLIGDNTLITFACLGKKSVRTPTVLLMEMLVFQISIYQHVVLLWNYGLFLPSAAACACHLGHLHVLPGYIFVHWPFGAWISPFAGNYVIPMAHVLCGAFGWLMKTSATSFVPSVP